MIFNEQLCEILCANNFESRNRSEDKLQYASQESYQDCWCYIYESLGIQKYNYKLVKIVASKET
jgi:hypothetical protein